MQPPNDRSSSIPVGSFADLITSANGNQPYPTDTTPTLMPLPRDHVAPLSAMTSNPAADFAAFQQASKGSLEPRHPETSEPDLSKASFPPVDTMPNVVSGGK